MLAKFQSDPIRIFCKILIFIIFFLSLSLALSSNISIVAGPIALKLGLCIVTGKNRSPIHFKDRTVKANVTRRQNKKINSLFLCRFSFDLLQTLPVYRHRATDKPSLFSDP